MPVKPALADGFLIAYNQLKREVRTINIIDSYAYESRIKGVNRVKSGCGNGSIIIFVLEPEMFWCLLRCFCPWAFITVFREAFRSEVFCPIKDTSNFFNSWNRRHCSWDISCAGRSLLI